MTTDAADVLKVVLLLERAEAWGNVRGLWQVMRTDPRFDPSLWLLPSVDRDGELIANHAFASMLDTANVPYVPIAVAGDARDLAEADILIVNHPYDRDRPPAFSFHELRRLAPFIAYLPYGLVVGANRRNQYLQYAQPTQEQSDAVFVRSAYEKRLYRQYCPRGDAHVHALGLPRLDDLADFGVAQADPELIRAIGGRTAILWNSHFSFRPGLGRETRYSSFDRLGGALFALARRRPELALIWRPHPRLFDEAIAAGLISAGQLPALRAELLRAGIILDERPDHRHAFTVAAALLTDPGSFLIEFLATGKPMLLLRPFHGAELTEEAEDIAACIDEASTPFEVEAFIDRVQRSEDSRREMRAAMRQRVLGLDDGHAARRIVNAMAALCRPAAPPTADTPLMAAMEQRLAAIALAKSAEPDQTGIVVTALMSMRGWLAQQVKRHPTLLSMARRLGLA